MTNSSEITAKPGARALVCPRCGAAFSCDVSGRCWCADEAFKLPMPVTEEDCLCQNCLRAEARRQSAT